MPKFMDRPTEGMCERMGGVCARKEHYINAANRFNATPRQFTSTLNPGGKDETTWYFWGLNVPDDEVVAVSEAIAEDSPEMTMIGGYVMPYWLREFPCFIGCDITICHLCNKQHEKGAIVDGQCIYKIAADEKAAEKAADAARIKEVTDKYQAEIAKNKAKNKAKEEEEEDSEKYKPVLTAAVTSFLSAEARKKALTRLDEAQKQVEKNQGSITSPSWAAIKDKYADTEQAKIEAGVIAPGDTEHIDDNESNEEQERKI